MGLADFFATAGRGTGIGQVAEAFGGRTPRNQALDNFINNELPQITQSLNGITDEKQLSGPMMQLMKSWNNAGLPLDQTFEKFSERLIAPALQGIRREGLDAIARDYGSKTTPITPMVAPEGQGQRLDVNQMLAPQTTPARNPLEDPEGAMRVARATGANPEQFRHMLEAPAELKAKQASTAMTTRKLADLETENRDIESLSAEPVGDTGVSRRQLAKSPALAALFPQRELSSGATALRQQGLDLQSQRIQNLAERVSSGQATAQERLQLQQDRLDFDRKKLEAQQQGTVTETEAPVRGVDRLALERSVARLAKDRGITDSEGIKNLFRDQGYEVEGEPKLNVPGPTQTTRGLGSMLPASIAPLERDKEGKPIVEPATLTGDFRIINKPRTTTKRPGAPAGTAPQGTPAAGGGTVMMEAPDGSKRAVPAARVEEFKRKGAKIVGQ